MSVLSSELDYGEVLERCRDAHVMTLDEFSEWKKDKGDVFLTGVIEGLLEQCSLLRDAVRALAGQDDIE